MRHTSLKQPEKWIIIGIPALFIIGSAMHFLYNILWKFSAVGLIAPINESIWEHSKMILWPLILWWSLYYRFRAKKYEIDISKWFTGALVALVTSLLAMPMLYYFYTGAFGKHLLWVDVAILLIALLFGQLLGLHTYRYGKGINVKFLLAAVSIIIVLFILFTFFPPHIPLFQDAVTGNYGFVS